MQFDKKTISRKAIGLLDLTNLNDDCDDKAILDLCKKAQTRFGNTAAVCIWKEFIPLAKKQLEGTGIKIATVVNFPHGGTDTDTVLTEVETAIKSGADEIDLVFPYNSFLCADIDSCIDQISRVRDACRAPVLLKVILETGKLIEDEIIYSASRLAIDCGADFIKTSTGKVDVNATPHAARIMLEAIRDSARMVGFKPAGGIKSVEDAATYLSLADTIMGEKWASPETLRFGASGVLASLVATLEDGDQPATTTGY